MATPAEPGHRLRFGEFQLDLRTGELSSGSQKLYLPEQPLQILAVLLERPGQLVTREDLIGRLWPSNTYVDFDHSLNRAVNRLREVLEDSADRPRFIETLPRRGYRFIAPVEPVRSSVPRSQLVSMLAAPRAPEVTTPLEVRGEGAGSSVTPRRIPAGFIAGFLALVVGCAAWWFVRQKPFFSTGDREFKLQQLTADSSENAVTGGAISPDGRYLAYANVKGVHIKLIGTDQAQDVPTPEDLRGAQVTWTIVANWVGGGTGFLANATPYGHQPSIWAVPAMAGPMRKIHDDAFAWAVSRDGSKVAFGSSLSQLYYREIWVMRPDGGEARKLFDGEENSTFGGAEWSPDGRRLAYVKIYQTGEKSELSIESRSLDGGPPVRAISIPYDLEDWTWAPDGRIFTSFPDPSDQRANTCNFWETRIDKHSGKPLEQPRQMTNWSGFCVDEPSVSADGKRLAFRRTSVQSGVYFASSQADGTRITTPRRLTLDEGRNYPVAWTADGKAIVVVSDRNGKREALTHSLGKDAVEPITVDLGEAKEAAGGGLVDLVLPRISPDGAWILYLVWSSDFASSAPVPLMRVSMNGGPAQLVLTSTLGAIQSIRCARAPASTCLIAERTPDRRQLIFTTFDPLKGRGQEAARFETVPTPDAEYTWDLSTDGTRIAILRRSENSVHLISLEGRAPQEVVAKDWTNFEAVAWAADGRGLFVSALTKDRSAILHMDLKGTVHLLREFEGIVQPSSSPFTGGSSAAYAVPSPDGRRLAICSWDISSNMWMMEGF